jgi:hypothetical protein
MLQFADCELTWLGRETLFYMLSQIELDEAKFSGQGADLIKVMTMTRAEAFKDETNLKPEVKALISIYLLKN